MFSGKLRQKLARTNARFNVDFNSMNLINKKPELYIEQGIRGHKRQRI